MAGCWRTTRCAGCCIRARRGIEYHMPSCPSPGMCSCCAAHKPRSGAFPPSAAECADAGSMWCSKSAPGCEPPRHTTVVVHVWSSAGTHPMHRTIQRPRHGYRSTAHHRPCPRNPRLWQSRKPRSKSRSRGHHGIPKAGFSSNLTVLGQALAGSDGTERALDELQLEFVVGRRLRASQQFRGRGLRAARQLRSAASTRQGLCATPPSATRPLPSRCTTAATEPARTRRRRGRAPCDRRACRRPARQHDGGDQLAGLQRRLDVRRVAGQAMEVRYRDRAAPAPSGRPSRPGRRAPHGDRHVARMRRDAGVAAADHRVRRLKPRCAAQPLPGSRLLQGWLVS